ncbi:hypothetical protein BJ970_007151 [Saccharopolyspora phatthalungensis]|uniref:Uncharacterized protein n=1 Tax=Saccharopolyspora phatthalungensis TaxID=664693 RepID=A0A840QAI7_9PSEU|nr:hypothetical protein [Saccharopolyspora phatthalungensis]
MGAIHNGMWFADVPDKCDLCRFSFHARHLPIADDSGKRKLPEESFDRGVRNRGIAIPTDEVPAAEAGCGNGFDPCLVTMSAHPQGAW